jgi:hypothetical protein
MYRRTVLPSLATAVALNFGSARVGEAQQRWLIASDERTASAKAAKTPRAGISPVDFDIRFQTKPPAAIDPTSIRVLYGFLRLDITSRIKEFGGEISARGITLIKAPLQPDSYLVTIEVANSQGRKTRRTVRFDVA